MPKESNQVIVRVWTSRDNKRFPGHNVGHVSIETPTSYISLWPVPFTLEQIAGYRTEKVLEQNYDKYYMERDPDWKASYQDDYKAEGDQEPQVIICLYSLDVNDIESAFGRLQNDTKAWRLVGSNMLLQKLETLVVDVAQSTKLFDSGPAETVENCASLALKLLKAGGINNLVSFAKESSFSSQTSSAVSPDRMLEILIPSKLKELDRHTETQGYQLKDETPNDTLKGPEKSSCLVM